MTAHPAVVVLPGGALAALVPGSRPPRYALDGSPCDLDVTIPDDLRGWWWHGSWLCNERAALFTGDYGLPGVFEQARRTQAPRIVQLTFFEEAA